jgi:hypothetical protein
MPGGAQSFEEGALQSFGSPGEPGSGDVTMAPGPGSVLGSVALAASGSTMRPGARSCGSWREGFGRARDRATGRARRRSGARTVARVGCRAARPRPARAGADRSRPGRSAAGRRARRRALRRGAARRSRRKRARRASRLHPARSVRGATRRSTREEPVTAFGAQLGHRAPHCMHDAVVELVDLGPDRRRLRLGRSLSMAAPMRVWIFTGGGKCGAATPAMIP